MKYLNCILLLFCVGNFLNHVHGNECDTVPGTLQYFNSLTSRVSLVYTDSEDLLGFGYNDSSVSHFYQDGLVKFYATQPVAVHFYFMYSECNRTYNIDFSEYIPDLRVTQPKCLYTNATITQHNIISNLILTYHVEDHFSDISYSFNVGSNISFPVTGFGGYKVIIDYPMGDTDFSVLVLPESDKVPLISLSHSNYSIGNGAIQIQNLNQFTNVQLINSSGVNIAASAPGQYSGLVSGTYYLSAVSNECGTQYIPLTIKPIYPNPIVNLVASQCGQPSMGVNMSITLEGVPDDQVTYQFNGNQYQAGEILNILPNEYFFSFNINNDQYYFNTFVLIPNPITKELPLTYSIDHPLSCLSDSAVLFINYTGDYQDIKVNGEVIASNFKRNVNYGETYSITKECSTFQDSIAFPFAEPIIEYYTEDFNYANCFSNFTVIVSNYQLFTTLVLSDQYSNINYTSVDGSFKNVRASNTFAVYYQEKGCQKEATYTFTIDINPVEPSDIHFELSNNQFDGCVDQFGSFTPIVFGRRYDDAVVNTTFTLDIYSALEIIPPYYFCREFNFYTPSPRPNLSTVDFDSVVCQESLTKVRVNSSVHVYSIGVDSNTFTDIDKTVVSGGNHSIFVNYGSCSDVFEVYVPYTKANVISYNVVPQSATNCSFPTAAIYFNNLNDFISLSIEGEDVTNATDIYPGTFLFNFNHSVCGLGEFSVIVGMDGTFEIETFVEPYYGYGLLKYTILDNNGSEITPTLVQGYNHYPFAHLIGDITDARATSFLSKGNFCRWMFDVSYDPQDPRWVEDPLTLNLTNEPLPYVDGFASVTDVLEGKPHQIQPYVSGSGFINRELTQVYGVQDSTSLNVYYNSKNYRINLDVPYTESITDLFEPVSYNCKNLEIVMKLSDSNTDYEMFLDNEKVDTNSFKMSVFLDSPLYYKKSSGVLKIQQNAPFGINSFAPYPTITYGNPTCLGKDGFVAITNPDPDYIYRAYFNIEGDNRNLPEISDGTYLNFTGLDSGNIVIAVVSRYNYLCTNSFDFDLKATEFTTTYNVKNQCVAGRNGSVVLSSFYGTKAADAIYTLNGVQVSNSLSLGIGNYSIVSDVASGTCKFALQTLFTVESNIISSTINSPSCGTINIVSTASLNDSLTLELLYSSNNSVITTLKNTNRYTFNNLNGADYLVRITEISGCQSTTPVTVNECQVPTTTTTTSSTTSDPINNSNRVIPSLLLFIIVLLVLLN